MYQKQNLNHALFMSAAIDLAESSCAYGNHPFGAVLVLDGQIILKAENTVVTDRDCTAHAELNLVRQSSSTLNRQTLKRSVLYSSTEPCAMCSGSIYWAGIRSVVYGCSVEDLARYTTGSFVVPCREVFSKGSEATRVEGPLFPDRAIELHANFWPNLNLKPS